MLFQSLRGLRRARPVVVGIALVNLLLTFSTLRAQTAPAASPGNPDQPVNVTATTALPVYGNPNIRDKYTADPAALVHKGGLD